MREVEQDHRKEEHVEATLQGLPVRDLRYADDTTLLGTISKGLETRIQSHKMSPVIRKTYFGSKHRGQKRKTSMEMGAGHRRMARHNNNTGRKIGRGSFAVPKEDLLGNVLERA